MKNITNQYFDIYIRDIQIIVYKKEDKSFLYNCVNREDAGFIIIESGDGYFKPKDGAETHLKSGDVILIDRHDNYVISAKNDDFSYVTMQFSLGEGQKFRNYNIPYVVSLDYEEELKELSSNLVDAWKSKTSNYRIRCRGILNDLLLSVTHNLVKKTIVLSGNSVIYESVKYLSMNYPKGIKIEDVANKYGYSASQYRKKFREFIGISPIEYVEQIRIDSAKEMIKSGMFSFLDISNELGYSDIYHFSKDFKKNTGITPKEYEKTLKK